MACRRRAVVELEDAPTFLPPVRAVSRRVRLQRRLIRYQLRRFERDRGLEGRRVIDQRGKSSHDRLRRRLNLPPSFSLFEALTRLRI